MKVQYDKALEVALGNSRKTKTWKNKTLLWSDLLDRMKTPQRTSETVAEFKAMSRGQQGDIKDVGGFVGGYCNNGSRSDVRHRSVLCLDADFADAELWPDWLLHFGNAAAVYSTHKHTPAKQRLRLVVPLARVVDGDEYQAIGRRVAERLGIDKFDDTSYQPQRVMFWPSCSQDGEYVFKYNDAPLLDPDAVLATYHDWADVSSWPMSSRVAEIVKRSATKQKDPLEKKGLVGAFCRAYTIQEAIEEYIPEYQPSDDPGRYTYTGGSTSSGVVVYDDKFTFSHHATDPASGKLLNAWDLVRVHKFNGFDENVEPGAPVNSRPSYKAMSELAANDERVKRQIVDDRLAAAAADFKDTPTGDDSWKSRLQLTEKGLLAQTTDNVILILNNAPGLAGRLAFNELECNVVVTKSLPWRRVKGVSLWANVDDSNLRRHLESNYGLTSKDKINDAIAIVAAENAYHPVRGYLDGCKWDGIPRAETLLVDYLGAEDTPYTRAVTRKTLAAAVARIYEPGCKFDYMLTIRGEQGIGKSALIAKLGGPWFSDTFTTLQGKDAYEQILGAWLVEVGELAGMRKAEAETIKLYISKTSDRFRQAYARRVEEHPRQCIFIGTTNETQFLRDTTGNRRFWVVDTPETPTRDMWDDLTPETVAQIWAEAKEFYNAGEKLYLSGDLLQAAREIQESYEEENPNVGIVGDYLDRLLPEDWNDLDTYSRRLWLESKETGTVQRTIVCTREILVEALGQNPDRVDRVAQADARAIMAKFPNWKSRGRKQKTIKPYGKQRYYERVKYE